MSKRVRGSGLVIVALMLAMALSLTQYHANAGPDGATNQPAAAAINGNVSSHKTLIEQGVQTMPNTTPVVGDWVCLQEDADYFAASLTIQGTMTGTNPAVTIKIQSSDDEGLTAADIAPTFAAINSTVTPSAGKARVTFKDEPGGVNTPPALVGDCFRYVETWSGTGTVTANLGVTLYTE